MPSTFKLIKEQFGELIEGDQFRTEATFRFTVTELSKYKYSKEYRLSPACVVRNLSW